MGNISSGMGSCAPNHSGKSLRHPPQAPDLAAEMLSKVIPRDKVGAQSMVETQAAQPEERDVKRASRKMHRAPKPQAEPQIPQNSTVPGITAQPGQGGKQQHPKKRPKASSPPHPWGGKSRRSQQARAGGGEGRAGAVAARGRRCRGHRGQQWLVLTGWPLEPGGRSCLGRRVAEAPD